MIIFQSEPAGRKRKASLKKMPVKTAAKTKLAQRTPRSLKQAIKTEPVEPTPDLMPIPKKVILDNSTIKKLKKFTPKKPSQTLSQRSSDLDESFNESARPKIKRKPFQKIPKMELQEISSDDNDYEDEDTFDRFD
jgi:hypothetical protein